MTRIRFGDAAPEPYFRRRFDRNNDPEKLARVLSTAVNELGARVPARWAHESLGIPQSGENEEVLPGQTRTSSRQVRHRGKQGAN